MECFHTPTKTIEPEILKKELNISIIASIVYIILGTVITVRPQTTLFVVSTIVAVSALVYGVITTIISIANIKEEGNLTFGILLIVLGIALLIYRDSLNILISLGIGIWFISGSVNRIKLAVRTKDSTEFKWVIIFYSAIVTLLIGISFIFSPLASAINLTTVSGVLMIIYSALDIFEVIFIKRNIRAIEKVLR